MRSARLRPERLRRRGGFTLMEVLLVLAILVIIGALVVVNFANVGEAADKQAAKVQIEGFEKAVKLYQIQIKRLPPTLEALQTPPSDLPDPTKWSGPYLDEEIPLDPWGNPYQYSLDGTTFRIWSMGPDMADGTDDDIDNHSQS